MTAVLKRAPGIVALILISRFISYALKAGQIAMMTRGVSEGELPDNVIKEGRRVVKERFATAAGKKRSPCSGSAREGDDCGSRSRKHPCGEPSRHRSVRIRTGVGNGDSILRSCRKKRSELPAEPFVSDGDPLSVGSYRTDTTI